ncbi:hypothetical protein CXG81DRAFT_3000, partial [Caulochytrium protostelioides]
TLTRLCDTLQEQLLNDSGIDLYLSGTTALLAVVVPQGCWLANIGDSGAPSTGIIWHAHRLTADHTFASPAERDRIARLPGARVEALLGPDGAPDGPLRLFKGTLPYPGIVVTRSLGDAVASRLGVIATPDIVWHAWRHGHDACLVLGTDGLWDGI